MPANGVPVRRHHNKNMRAAVIQLNSQNDTGHNLEAAEQLVKAAHAQGAEYALLPENFAFFGSEQEKSAKAAEIETAARAFLKSTSAKHKITITGGGMPIANAGGKVFNSAVTYGPDGAELHRYDKLHLFDVTPGDNVSYQESRSTAPGGGSLSLFACGTMQVGMSVCYDIRFPALYRHHAKTGAQVLCVPAAFTRLTGEAHWHVLLRSRAIENTCYVLAAAQTGTHFGGRETFGHSMIGDPWGEVLGELNDRPGVLVHELKSERIEEVRRRMPSLQHDRL